MLLPASDRSWQGDPKTRGIPWLPKFGGRRYRAQGARKRNRMHSWRADYFDSKTAEKPKESKLIEAEDANEAANKAASHLGE